MLPLLNLRFGVLDAHVLQIQNTVREFRRQPGPGYAGSGFPPIRVPVTSLQRSVRDLAKRSY